MPVNPNDERESERRSNLIVIYRLVGGVILLTGLGGFVVFLADPRAIRTGVLAMLAVLVGIYGLAFPRQIADRRLRRVRAELKRRNQDENHAS